MAGRHPLPPDQKRHRIVLYLTLKEWEALKVWVPRVPVSVKKVEETVKRGK